LSVAVKGAVHEALEALVARVPRGMMLGLDRVERALGALGDPHAGLQAVHVAGSNGKGSTSAMVEAVARAAGLRTGLYTSPHLSRFAERIRVDGAPVSDEVFARAIGAVIDRCPPDLTFFESLTVAAFVAFREARIDVAVLEVGLGGRLDATNVLASPLATAITSISLEHTAMLGDTLGAIAREKAGIFKAGAPVVLGPLPEEAAVAAREVAARVGAGPLARVVREGARAGDGPIAARDAREAKIAAGDTIAATLAVAHEDGVTRIVGPRAGDVLEVRLALEGSHQASNAGVAVGLLDVIAARFPGHDVRGARARGLSSTSWPGRLERIARGEVTVLFDAAHNPEGIGALRRAMEAMGTPPERVTLVFGALADKRWQEMLEMLAPVAARRVYTRPKGRAPAAPEDLAGVAAGEAIDEPRGALERALARSGAGDVVLVAGSIYLVGELRAALLGIEADPIIAL
jgi:dihydrofolate synthase/folylpolyglutamate synthase